MGSLKKGNIRVIIFLAIIILVGCLLRLHEVEGKLHTFDLVGDAKNYQIMSTQIVDNGIYGYALGKKSGISNAYVTPGYPLFLAAIYAILRNPYLQITAARCLQVLIGGLLTPLLAYLFTRRLFKNDYIALLTSLFTAIYPTYVFSVTYILTEVCSLAAMLLYFYLQTASLQEKKPYISVLAGAAFALNILIRPTMLPLVVLPFIFALIAWDKSSRLLLVKLFALSMAGFAIVMLPWWVRNYFTMHKLILLSTGSGDPLLAGSYPYMKDLFQDYYSQKVRLPEDAFAKTRIIAGFTKEPLLFLKWYTLGKLNYLFSQPWLYVLPPYHSILSMIYYKFQMYSHNFFVYIGMIGMLLGSLIKKVNLYLSIYAILLIGLLLIFIPVNRYAYQSMFLFMVFTAFILHQIAAVIVNGFRTVKS